MTDKLLEKLRIDTKADKDFYSNPNKSKRECLTVSFFLSAIKVKHTESELHSLEQDSHIDVKFHEVNFQLKEIVNPHFKRNDFYKRIFESANSVEEIQQVDLTGPAFDVPEMSIMVGLIFEQCIKLSKKYKDKCPDIDLLFEVTRPRSKLITENDLKINFQKFNFRSISCVNSKQAVVLYASEQASQILRNKLGITLISS